MENLTANETKALLWILGTVLAAFGGIIIWLFKAIYNYAKQMSADIEEQSKTSIKIEYEIKMWGQKHDALDRRVNNIEEVLKNFRGK